MIYILENDYIKACVSDLGATLTKFIDKKTNTDLVLGFDSDEDYIKYGGTNIGASVGRNANRIGNASFSLNGKEYKLTVNDNCNQLHGGGMNGFAFKRWTKQLQTKDELVLSYYSKDSEEGFPGNVNVEVSYKLENNSLIWSYSGESDADTILNMTNHSYFNLGDDNIMNHELMITTDKYSPIDENSLTKEECINVKDTPYDFTSFRKIEDNLNELECGIDNNYVWETLDDKLMASLRFNNIQMNVYSDLPDMHLYTAYYLNGEKGKYGKTYSKYGAVCLECQYYPNSLNYSSYIKPLLKANEKMSHYIRFEIESEN